MAVERRFLFGAVPDLPDDGDGLSSRLVLVMVLGYLVDCHMAAMRPGYTPPARSSEPGALVDHAAELRTIVWDLSLNYSLRAVCLLSIGYTVDL